MSTHAVPSLLPTAVGIGLRAPHMQAIMDRAPALGFLEIHSENYFTASASSRRALTQLRTDYPISTHGVGLSLGSASGLTTRHLERLADLVNWLEPALVSEHLSWGAVDDRHLNDLLPLPYTREALAHMVHAVDSVQTRLKRRILIENVSSYLVLPDADMTEWEFLGQLALLSGCGLLLDVNNVYVSACNHGFDPCTYLDAVPISFVEELHVAGHSHQEFGDETLIVDTHDGPVAPAVWDLLCRTLARCGPRPVLVEWDSQLPPFAQIEQQALLAATCMERSHARAA